MLDEARETLEQGRHFCETTDERILLPEILRALAGLAVKRNNGVVATQTLKLGCERAAEMGAHLLRLRCLADLIHFDLASDEQSREFTALEATLRPSIGAIETARLHERVLRDGVSADHASRI